MKKILFLFLFVIAINNITFADWITPQSDGSFRSDTYGTQQIKNGLNEMQNNPDVHWVYYDVNRGNYFPFKQELEYIQEVIKQDINTTGGTNYPLYATQEAFYDNLKSDWIGTYFSLDHRKTKFNDHYNSYKINISNFPNEYPNYGDTFDDLAKFWIDNKLLKQSPLSQSDINYMNETNYRVSDISTAIKVSDVRTYDDPKILEYEQNNYGGSPLFK